MAYITNEELLRALSCIRKRPGMFLYPLTLASLGNYICGYKLCCTLNDIHQEDDRGELNHKDIENAVWNAIPDDDIMIDDNHKAVWQSASELYLDSESMNCGKCAKYQGWTTDKEKPNWIEGLCSGATVDGELLCDECLPKGHRWAF